MARITLSSALVALIVAACFSACDGKPVVDRPQPAPGFKDGETPVPEPEGGAPAAPLPPATTPATPGEPNNPSAPLPPPTEPLRPTSGITSAAATTAAVRSDVVPPPDPGVRSVPPPLEAGAGVTPPPPAAGTGPISGRDEVITAAAYRVLALQSGLSAGGKVVTISTVEGRVQLRGAVADDEERQRIIAAIGRIDGVRMIEDHLDVQ